jgi:hypothetical protein
MGDCLLTLISNTSVSASFIPLPLIQIEGSTNIYLTFLAALIDAPNIATFKSRNATISENVLLDRLQDISLIGGLNEDFVTGDGFTVLNGTLTVRNGSLKVKGFVIR